jgi:hypothetical protein
MRRLVTAGVSPHRDGRYRRKLAKWGFEKKIKGKEREVIVRKLVERGAAGKTSAFTLRGRRVYPFAFLEYPERTKKSIQNITWNISHSPPPGRSPGRLTDLPPVP